MNDVRAGVMSPEELAPAVSAATRILTELNRILLGHESVHELVLIGILSRGHILLEGLPGVGKTALVKALGDILEIDFNRVQFTPDLMPSDILGSNILQEGEGGRREMVFQPGPVFTNILLADEINRASPKTQSAMLEAMQERSVTLLGETRVLPEPFFVLASQNPIEMEGTYPIPEAQLDRFLFKLDVGTVSATVLEEIISSRRRGEPPPPEWRVDGDDWRAMMTAMEKIILPRAVANYIGRLVESSQPAASKAPDAVRDYVSYGASPRAAIALAEAARGVALIAGRPTVGFEDVEAVLRPVLNHRLILNYKARMDNVGVVGVIDSLLESVEAVELGLPKDMEVA